MNLQVKLAILSIIVVISIASIAVYGTGSNQQFTKTHNDTLQVMSSFAPLHDFSQKVGKDKINSALLVPVGVEPHDWEPTIKDVQKMETSDLIIINGIGFESWVDDLKKNNFQGTIVDTSNNIPINQTNKEHTEDEHTEDEHTEDEHTEDEHTEDEHTEDEHTEDEHTEDEHTEDEHTEDEHTEDEHTEGDPHIWLNPVYAKIQVQNIANAFSDADPVNRDYYQNNAENYIDQLSLLDIKIRSELSSCQKDFIAFHDAFSYFAKEYDLKQHTIISSNDSHGEATAKTLENVISTARELNIKVIFSEELLNAKTSEIIANEINGKVLILSPLEVISDGTYISKMTENLENLKEALC